MLLAIVVIWLVVNALIVAFLLLHPLRHFSSAAKRASAPAATPAETPRQRSMI